MNSGDKHKISPKLLVDSFETGTDENMPEEPVAGPSHSCSTAHAQSSIADRFKNLREAAPKTSKSDQVLQELRLHQEEHNRQFKIIENHLNKTADQRERFLDLMQKFVSRKRKRQQDSDSE